MLRITTTGRNNIDIEIARVIDHVHTNPLLLTPLNDFINWRNKTRKFFLLAFLNAIRFRIDPRPSHHSPFGGENFGQCAHAQPRSFFFYCCLRLSLFNFFIHRIRECVLFLPALWLIERKYFYPSRFTSDAHHVFIDFCQLFVTSIVVVHRRCERIS